MINRDRTSGVRGVAKRTTNPRKAQTPEAWLDVRFQPPATREKLTGDGRPMRPSALSSCRASPTCDRSAKQVSRGRDSASSAARSSGRREAARFERAAEKVDLVSLAKSSRGLTRIWDPLSTEPGSRSRLDTRQIRLIQRVGYGLENPRLRSRFTGLRTSSKPCIFGRSCVGAWRLPWASDKGRYVPSMTVDRGRWAKSRNATHLATPASRPRPGITSTGEIALIANQRQTTSGFPPW